MKIENVLPKEFGHSWAPISASQVAVVTCKIRITLWVIGAIMKVKFYQAVNLTRSLFSKS